jgi:iron complex outermembrane receptor protein
VNISYDVTDRIMLYGGYARGQKSGGINMAGLPTDAAGNPVLSKAVVGPETHSTFEIGLKSRLFGDRLTANVNAFHVDVTDFQANVVDTVAAAALRNYLANIPKVVAQGFEYDATFRLPRFSLRLAGAYTDARYDDYPKGPCPIEQVGGASTVCDLSGQVLPGTPNWSGSIGGEYGLPMPLGQADGEIFLRADLSAHSSVQGDGTGSIYQTLPAYALVNSAVGYRTDGWDVSLFVHNLFDADYIRDVTAQAGNSGLILANPGEPRMIGLTLRARM